MSWVVVARKDFRDARLSKALWAITAAFVLLSAGMAVLYATVPELSRDIGELSTLGYLTLLLAVMTLFVSIAAIVIGAGSIAGERDRGSSKLLLGFPHSRADVVLGKLLGRTAVLAVAILVGLAVTLAVILALFPSFSPVDYAIFAGVTLLFALVYVGIMVAVSATTGSGGRAMAFGVGVFVLLEFLGDLLAPAVMFVVNGFSFGGLTTVPGWYAFLNVVTPSAAYQNALGWFLGDGTTAALSLGGMLGGPVPFYLTGWASVTVLVVWLVVPLVFGYRRFAAADL
ncbi:ABC-2 type transport system permease protein [Halogeometricum rufum]|uniref:ABC-2 type transport system permease protein n=1 Tax=Halogeometricum rufum TaxID=553469 RepID=A0A1I6IG36_9EURY|nr:ABC transporter permease subunit [Halogeometricum rufum]SFR65631.1 ABC-2 type transport system permease protein [Halogeometricum rufum]